MALLSTVQVLSHYAREVIRRVQDHLGSPLSSAFRRDDSQGVFWAPGQSSLVIVVSASLLEKVMGRKFEMGAEGI